MKRILAFCFALVFLFSGCVKEDDIVFLGSEGVTIDSVEGTTFNITLRFSVENKSRSRVKLSDGNFIVYVRNRPTLKMALTDDVVIKGHRVQSVAMPARASVVGGMWAILPLAGELSAAGISTDQLMSLASGRQLTPEERTAVNKILRSPNITIKVSGKVKSGLAKRNLELGPMPINQMMSLIGPRLGQPAISPAQ